MSHSASNPMGPATAFRARCSELGLPAWRFNAAGLVTHRPNGFTERWLGLPGVEQLLHQHVARLLKTCRFGCHEIMPGVHSLSLVEGPPERPTAIEVALLLAPEILGAGGARIEAEETGADARGVIVVPQPLTVARADIPATAKLLGWLHAEAHAGARTSRTLNEFSERLSQSYEEVNMLFRLAGFLNCVSEPESLMQMFCDQLHATLPFRWVLIHFNAHGVQVPDLVGRLLVAGELPCDFALLDELFVELAEQHEAEESSLSFLKAAVNQVARVVSAEVVGHPIVHDGLLVGMVLAGNKQGPDPDLSSFETQFIDAAANLLSVFHENIARATEQQAMFMGTLHALTASIDAKDPYTSGHSERVAALATQMAVGLHLSKGEIEQYRITGMVHDVGKIGIPEAVLCKPGRLTDEEFTIIKQHPVIGERILRGIPKFDYVIPGVLHHHERWDGAGYPHRLQGLDIPLVARVLALADSFDAMSSNRSYRPAMPRDRVMAEIRRCAGSQFDPELAAIFVELDFAHFDNLLATCEIAARAA